MDGLYPGFNGRTFVSCGFSTEGTLISASAVGYPTAGDTITEHTQREGRKRLACRVECQSDPWSGRRY